MLSEKLLTPEKVSEILGITATTLSVWRCTKRYALRYLKIGGRVMYRPADIEAFVESRVRGNAPLETDISKL